MARFEQKIDQFTRRKIRGSDAGKFANLFKFLLFSKIIKNPGTWPDLNRKLIRRKIRGSEAGWC